MFCSQCGKKVTENMLFCPFCGKPIVIPNQEPETAASPERGARSENGQGGAAAASGKADLRTAGEERTDGQREGDARTEGRHSHEEYAAAQGDEPGTDDLRGRSGALKESVRADEHPAEREQVYSSARREAAETAARRAAEWEPAQKEAPAYSSALWENAQLSAELDDRAGEWEEDTRPARGERDAEPANGSAEDANRGGANAEDSRSVHGAGHPGRINLSAEEARPARGRNYDGHAADSRPARDARRAARAEAPSEEENVLSAVRSAPVDVQIGWRTERAEDAPDEDFQPLDLEEVDAPPRGKQPPTEELSELLSHRLREEPVRLKGRAPDLTNVHNPDRPGASSRRKASSYAPVREFNPDDMFMDGDDYDADDEDEEYAYEEPEEGGFFIRHIRGVVGLSLFVIVLAIVAGWAFSGGGQRVLAQANLAWQPSIYEQLGYDAYQNGQYAVAAGYYEQALRRNDRNYSYAYSAAVASYMAGDTEQAAEMGKRAVEIDATRVDGYQLLQRLYPDASARPWEIQSLIQQGYRLTGDASLNDAPQQ